MSKNRVIELIEELVTPIAKKNNLEIADVEFKKEGKDHFLRIYIDKNEGITLDDCQIISEELKNILDSNEEYDVPYDYLEVSSPGLNRLLKKSSDYERFQGSKVDVKLFSPVDGRRKFIAKLKSYNNNSIIFESEDEKIVEIAIENLASCRLVVEW